MSVTVVDKRGQGTRKAPDPVNTPPNWWPELVAIDTELGRATAKHGEPSEQGNIFAGFGNGLYRHNAAEYKRQNDARSAAGKPGHWTKIILEEVFEAFEIPVTPETAVDVYNELIQGAAMMAAAAEDLRKQFS